MENKSLEAIAENFNSEKVATYSLIVMMFGPEENMIAYEYFLVKNLEISGDEQSVRFRTLVHNKRASMSANPTIMAEIGDYPPIQEGENTIEYIERVAALPYMEWNDMYFDETITIRYRGRAIYTYDEDTGKYKYIKGDKLSAKEVKDGDKSTVVSFKPTNKDN